MGILPMSSTAILAVSITGILPVQSAGEIPFARVRGGLGNPPR